MDNPEMEQSGNGVEGALAELRQAGVSDADLEKVRKLAVGETVSGNIIDGATWSVTRSAENSYSIQSGNEDVNPSESV